MLRLPLSPMILAFGGGALAGLPLSPAARAATLGPIRFSDAYEAYLCADSAISRARKTYEQAEQERVKLRERYQDALHFPYAAEFRGYTPKPYEVLERDRIYGWPWRRCAWYASSGLPQPKPERKAAAPAGLNCRLDRAIFGDRRTGERFTATGVQLSLAYLVHVGTEKADIVKTPPPLGSDIPRVYGQIMVRGKIRGREAVLVHEWNKGAPSEMIYSVDKESTFKPLPASQIPYVDARTYDFYSFAIDEQLVGARLGPLRNRVWRPVACQE